MDDGAIAGQRMQRRHHRRTKALEVPDNLRASGKYMQPPSCPEDALRHGSALIAKADEADWQQTLCFGIQCLAPVPCPCKAQVRAAYGRDQYGGHACAAGAEPVGGG